MTLNEIDAMVGRRMKLLREKRGMSLDEAAEKIGTTGATLSNWEKAKFEIKLRHMVLAARAYEAPLMALIPEEIRGVADE